MAKTSDFATWLHGKLLELDTDVDVFGSYITGILDGEESVEEKREALNDILSEIIQNQLDELIELILDKWKAAHPPEDESAKKVPEIDVNEKLAQLLEAQNLQTTVKERQYTEEERRIREQILAQYSQTEVEDLDAYDSDPECEKPAATTGANSLSGIERNTNAHDVMQLQKERREQARLDCAAKKLKDREDREKQRQMREEKKEKRKTVKGERRR